MSVFMIRFLICNIFISAVIGIMLVSKRLLQKYLSSRMQYNLWFLLLGLLAVPFLPSRLSGYHELFLHLTNYNVSFIPNIGLSGENVSNTLDIVSQNWMNDFAVSVSNNSPFALGTALFVIWVIGILVSVMLMVKSALHLHGIQKSALPLQSQEVRRLYRHCLNEMDIKKEISIYSTAFFKSPIIVGLIRPRIYLPIHLISDYNETDMRYMLLHELQHYRHRDNFSNYLMNLTITCYWFNPFVWLAVKNMRNDREIACDTSVLKMLNEEDFAEYGNTLINFAEKLSQNSFPFAASLGGNVNQMKQRILNIANYESPTFSKTIKGFAAFILTAALLLGFVPALSTYAAEEDVYQWNFEDQSISYIDLSSYFGTYDGSFVFYNLDHDSWNIYNIEQAAHRISPDSTYKIYDALFGLEEGVIHCNDSLLKWNKELYDFEEWNADQTLQTAMASSVNWYFQSIDTQLGTSRIQNYLHKINYGNEDTKGGISAYWLESSLKISPVEQVELLVSLYDNSFDFSQKNVDAVKEAILISSSGNENIYGKTGTGRVNGQDVNGWFVGFIETADNTFFFATNIQAKDNAVGSKAAEITMEILSDLII